MFDGAAVNNGALPPFPPPRRLWGRTLLSARWWEGGQHRGLGCFLCPHPPKKKKVSPVGVVGAESASAPSPRVAQGLPVVLWALFLWSYKRSALRCNGAFWA